MTATTTNHCYFNNNYSQVQRNEKTMVYYKN
jgi:hypothetical protein